MQYVQSLRFVWQRQLVVDADFIACDVMFGAPQFVVWHLRWRSLEESGTLARNQYVRRLAHVQGWGWNDADGERIVFPAWPERGRILFQLLRYDADLASDWLVSHRAPSSVLQPLIANSSFFTFPSSLLIDDCLYPLGQRRKNEK